MFSALSAISFGCVSESAGDGGDDGIGGDTDTTLRILGNVRPDGACGYPTSEEASFYDEGFVDIAFGRPYVAHLLVENVGTDPVLVDRGFRNVRYEPQHEDMIRGEGEAATRDLVLGAVTIPGGSRQIVEVDPLGEGFIVYKRQFEGVLSGGSVPADEEASTTVVLRADADGAEIESPPWEFRLFVGLGSLVQFEGDPGGCCEGPSSTGCEAGQNDVLGSCADCASCWPEVCNSALVPASCGFGPCS